MRVTYISNLYPPFVRGGAELIASYLAEEVAASGHDVTVVTTTEHQHSLRWAIDNAEILNGVRVIRLSPDNLYWVESCRSQSKLRKAAWHAIDLWNPRSLSHVSTLLEELDPELVHTHNIDGFSPAIWGAVTSRKIPLVHTSHDYHLMCPKATLLRSDNTNCVEPPLPCQMYRSWYKHMTGQVSVFCAPSQFLIDLHRRAGFHAKQWAVVPNGIPAYSIHPEATVPKEGNDVLRLLYIGQLNDSKGVGILLDSVRNSELPLHLRIAGSGPMREQVIAAQQIDSRIEYMGFVSGSQKQSLLRWADALVVPSIWYDNYPTTILEAFQSGAAVIGSRIGGIPEMIEDGVNGMLVDPGSVTSLRSCIGYIATKPDLLNTLCANAALRGTKSSVQRMASSYLLLYETSA